MKKSESKAVGILIVFAIIASPFVWLYEHIGGVGFIVIAVVGVALYLTTKVSKSKGDQQEFEKLARYVLHNDISNNEARNMTTELSRSDDFRKSQLIRNLQIMRDSITLSLSSKKEDTAASRVELLKEKFEDIRTNQKSIISDSLFKEIQTTVNGTFEEFKTAFYVNVAIGHIEKAESLKTDKPKIKYLRLAEAHLLNGIKKGSGNVSEISKHLSAVQKKISDLGGSVVKEDFSIKRNDDCTEAQSDYVEEDDLSSFTITVKTSGTSSYGQNRSTNKELGRWIPPNENIKVGKYVIKKGLIYVGGVLKGFGEYSTESSLVDPTLPVDSSRPDYAGDEIGYWPTYLDIRPSSRAAYLEWLAGDRNDADENIGYVFLYFYGLERRLLLDRANGKVDNKELQVLFNEIKRLLKIYGKNRSFRNYATNLISHLWILNGAKGNVSDELLIFSNSFSPVFQYLLAKSVSDGKPIPPNLAFAWVKGNPEFKLRTPARRCSSEFRKLFEKRYLEAFQPEGILIKPNKTKLSISYTPASSSLRGYEPIKFDLPDPTRLKSQAKKLCELAEKCTDDLDPYSRFLGRKGNSRDSVLAIAQLPTDLVNHLKIDKVELLKNHLKDTVSGDFKDILVESLLEMINEDILYKLNKKECETIAFLLESSGYGLAPDIRYHGAKLESNGSLVVFAGGHETGFSPSANFRAVGTILRLGAMVAKIDGEVSSPEVNYLENIIETDSKLSDQEKKSLHAYLHWRLVEPVNAKGLKAQLSGLKSNEKSAISNILINVAYADGHVDPSEVKQLEKLYVSLGLERESVTTDIHTISAQKEPSQIGLKEKVKIEDHTNSGAFIDMELLRRHEAETEGVKAILGEIFTEPESETSDQENIIPTENDTVNGSIIAELDEAHQTLYQKIITKEEWAREEILLICEQISLMVDGSIETINDWTFEHVDAPLIEEGELIYVDLELAEEISNINA